MKRATIVKNIHQVYTYKDFLPALSFGEVLPRSGDFVIIQLALRAIHKQYGLRGLNRLAILFAASELERKTGFITYRVLCPVYPYQEGANHIARLVELGLLERTEFPNTFSHIVRKVKVYKLSEKGHSCLRLFRDTYNSYQREVKRAKIKGAEIGK